MSTANPTVAPWAGMSFAASAACWGLTLVATKGLLARVPPFTVLVVQLAGSITFLWASVLATRAPVRLDRAAARAAASGLLEPGLAYAVGVLGLRLTTASSAAIIGAAETPMIVALAWLFLRERIGARALALAALAGLGVGLLMLPDLDGLGGGSLAGDLLVVLSTFLAAVYVTVSRRLVTETAPLPLAALQQTAGLGLALAVHAAAGAAGWEAAAPANVPAGTLLLLAATGIVQYALAFWFWLAGLRRTQASRAAVFLALIPLFGVAGAALWLGERLVSAQWVGAAVIVGAVWALARSEDPQPAPAHLGVPATPCGPVSSTPHHTGSHPP